MVEFDHEIRGVEIRPLDIIMRIYHNTFCIGWRIEIFFLESFVVCGSRLIQETHIVCHLDRLIAHPHIGRQNLIRRIGVIGFRIGFWLYRVDDRSLHVALLYDSVFK